MQYQYVTPQPDDFSEHELVTVEQTNRGDLKITHFQAHFEGCMEMYSDAQTVAKYLEQHEGWFCRCAEPMKTEPIGNNGYILAIGKYGAFGYNVEPKMAIILEPPDIDGVYCMHSIPLEGEEHLGYQVDYRALMTLDEVLASQTESGLKSVFKKHGITQCPVVVTKVTWELHMDIMVRFPKFISKLPSSLIQTTGDRLLSEIVRQISPRLTYKVQQDFHHRLSLPIPDQAGRQFQKIEKLT